MAKSKDKYTFLLQEYDQALKKLRFNRNLLTIAKVVLFAALCYMIYKWVNTAEMTYGFITVVSVISYLILNKIESGILNKIDLFDALIYCAENEIAYIEGNFSAFDKGEEYLDQEHAFAKDIDIFGESSLYQAINRCETPEGKDFLAKSLLYPSVVESEISEKQKAIAELTENIELCLNLRAEIRNHPVSRVDNESIEKWKNAPYFFSKSVLKYSVYVSNLIMLLLISGTLLSDLPFKFVSFWFVIQLGISILFNTRLTKSQNYLDAFIKGFGNYLFPVALLRGKKFKSSILTNIISVLFEKHNSEKEFSALKSIMETLDSRGNLIATVLLDGLFMRDIHTMISLDKWKKKNVDAVEGWKNSISELEMLISFAFYKFNNPKFCLPVFNNDIILKSTGMAHPLMYSRNPVDNNLTIDHLHQFFIVTGANMSGKSTFLRAVAVNWILALCGSVVNAVSFEFKPMRLFTSMRTSDNLSSGTSYFHAEILRLKSLLEIAGNKEPIFVILDEILKGTNSHDKLNGSRRFMLKLLSLPTTGIIATHDLELGELEKDFPEDINNICFEVEYDDNNELIYDYKLRYGISKNMNATFLLEKYGLV